MSWSTDSLIFTYVPYIKVVQSCIGTKFISRWADLAVKIAIDAVKKVTVVGEDGSGAKGRYSVLS